jgi:hypothetical protein
MGGFAPSEGWTAGNLKGGEEFRIIFSSTPKIPNPRFSDPCPRRRERLDSIIILFNANRTIFCPFSCRFSTEKALFEQKLRVKTKK